MYMPMLKSKKAELDALQKSKQQEMAPLIELLGFPPRQPSEAANPKPVLPLRQRISEIAVRPG